MDRSFGRLFRSHRTAADHDSNADAVQQKPLEKSRLQYFRRRRPGDSTARAGQPVAVESYTAPDDECGRPPTGVPSSLPSGDRPIPRTQYLQATRYGLSQPAAYGGDKWYVSKPGRLQYNEDVADRNLRLNRTGKFPDPVPPVSPPPKAIPIATGRRFSEDVADRNLVLRSIGVTDYPQAPAPTIIRPSTVHGTTRPIIIPIRTSSLQTKLTPLATGVAIGPVPTSALPPKVPPKATTAAPEPTQKYPIPNSGRAAPTPDAGMHHNDPFESAASNLVSVERKPVVVERKPIANDVAAEASEPSSVAATSSARGEQKVLSNSNAASLLLARNHSTGGSSAPRKYLDLTQDEPPPLPNSAAQPAPARGSNTRTRTDGESASANRHAPVNPSADPMQEAQSKALKDAGIDLTNTTDTDHSTRHAPAVVHEIIKPEVHHIREEQITREIHTHDVYHRILPIVDVEILPAKHYVRDPQTGALVEVPEHTVPGRAGGGRQAWRIEDDLLRPEGYVSRPVGRRFTARTFEGDEGQTRVWIGDDGVPGSERTWVHPPTLEDGAMNTGQTAALHLQQGGAGRERTMAAEGQQENIVRSEEQYDDRRRDSKGKMKANLVGDTKEEELRLVQALEHVEL